MLKNVLYSLVAFGVEFAKLFPLMFWVMKFELKPLKKVMIYSAIAICITALLGLLPLSADIPISSYVCLVFTMMILTGKRKIIYTLVTYIGICLFDMLAGSVILLFIDYDFISLIGNTQMSLAVNSINIFAVLLIVGISKLFQKNNKFHNSKIGIFYMLLILSGEIAILSFITSFQYSDKSNKVLAVALSISGVLFILICTVMILNNIAKENYKSISEVNQKLLKSQENYYLMLLQKEQDTIKFRHDIRNHINCMYLLFDKGQYDELREYFDKIGGALNQLSPTVQTGNDILNAILGDTMNRFPNVSCKVEGKIPWESHISQMDICTIFSNLIDNAFCAADKSNEKQVSISFRYIGESFFCEIRNSIAHKVEIVDNKLVTEKNDNVNHGHGIQNACRCAEANGGNVVFSCTDETFLAEIAFVNV